MPSTKRLLVQIQLQDFMPCREQAEYLLNEDLGMNESKVYRIIRILNHLKLSWELLSEIDLSEQEKIVDLIDLCFLNYFNQRVGELTEIIEGLMPKLYEFPTFQRLRLLVCACQQKIKDLAISQLNQEYVEKIH